MNPTTQSITEEILGAHTDALNKLTEAVKDPIVVEGFRRLFRCLETWELELLTSQIGRGIDQDTFKSLGGALAAFRLMKDLLTDLTVPEVAALENSEERGKRFTESLLRSPSRPV